MISSRVLVVPAGAIAALGLLRWLGALLSGSPLLYGEGAVANAARLLREGAAYRLPASEVFVAANYPPVYLALASIGDPLMTGRAVSILSALAVALVIARASGWRGVPFALAWLASVPVLDWAPAVKPDLLAVALTVGAAAALRTGARFALLAGVLLALAVATKPTALLPALALALVALTVPATRLRFAIGAAAGAAVVAAGIALLGAGDVWRHVVTWNVLRWSPEQLLLLVVLGIAVLGAPALLAARVARGAPLAYLIGAAAVVALGGREGATLNYLLDLSAASCFALAAGAVRVPSVAHALVAVQLLAGVIALDPFGVTPWRSPTGHWGDPARVAALREVLGPADVALVEDAGILVALGRAPVVDDLFLWSRLVESGLVDAAPLTGSVRAGRFAVIAAETDLGRLDDPATPAYARARWAPVLAGTIRERYVLAEQRGGLWIYRPR